MTRATAAFYDDRYFDSPAVSSGACRRSIRAIARFVATGIAAVGTVGVLIATVTYSSAWIVNNVVATNPIIHASAPAGPGALALVQADSTFAAAPAMTFADKWAHATASFQVAAVPVLTPQPRLAEVTPVPGPIPVTVTPLPPARPTEMANIVPLPPARPYIAPPAVAAATVHQIGAEFATQVAATVAPLPPAIKRVAPAQEAHTKLAALPGPDSHTAVYDIAAHTVYLPNGQRLEAHSGLGDKMDDPHFVKVRMRGPTPPNVYDLTLREEIFHGVRAIRLNPVDEDRMYGRAGMLAHSYMLGPNGQSNGCVSFKDYDKFLHAFLKGQVDRMVVVARLADLPSRIAYERRGRGERFASND
jgi:hypothetical protein